MPWDKVMDKFKKGKLHSSNKSGKKVTDKKQALAIMLSEKKSGKPEYQPIDTAPSKKIRGRFGK